MFFVASLLDEVYGPYRMWRWPDSERNGYLAAKKLKREALSKLDVVESMNTFSWAKAVLIQKSPAAAAAVKRFEADSKFFRSFTIVLLILAFGLLLEANGQRRVYAVVSFVIALASFLRFAERRYKSTEWAYRHVIVMAAEGGHK